VRKWPDPQGDQCSDDPLQGLGLGQEGTICDGDAEGFQRTSRDWGDGRGVDRWIEVERGRSTGYGSHSESSADTRRSDTDGRLIRMAATDWVTLAEAADILATSNVHFTPATIGGWARSGRLQSIKLGGRRFVRRGEIRALVNAPRRVRVDDLQPGLFESLDP
jgi:hypothetical protein